ncbi:MAG: DNA polymerase I [Rickettsiales bacterium]|jgi:DNA polymerase-1|nr:DNA polymerase I [Rickettsiales bacterium]
MDKKKLVLVDGYSFFFRAYFALKSVRRRSDGVAVNGVYGFTRMLMNLIVGLRSTHIAVVFDTGGKTFRHDIFQDYKANRPPVPDDMKPQFPMLREVVNALNVKIVEREGYEADDVIATLVKQAERENYEVWIISGDKDLMQLVSENVFLYETKEAKKIGIAEVVEKWGVEPSKLLDVLSLMGDNSDNVPGVPSIGQKTAVELVNSFGSVESLIKNVENIGQEKRKIAIRDNIDKLLLSKKLITLCDDIDLGVSIDDLVFKNFEPAKFVDFLYKMEFDSIAKEIEKVFNIQQSTPSKKTGYYEYKKITDLAALKDICEEIIQNNNQIIFEITTENNDSYENLKTICFSNIHKKYIFYVCISAAYVARDLFSNDDGGDDCLTLDAVMDVISVLFTNRDLLKISYNMKKQLRILKQHGIIVENYDDISVMSYLLDNGKFNQTFSNIIEFYLYSNIEIKINEIEKNNFFVEQYEKGKNLSSIGSDIFDFSCLKIEIMTILYKIVNERLSGSAELKKLYIEIEKPLIKILADIEFNGVRVDVEELQRLSNYFHEELKNIEKKIYGEVGFEFNINSPKQLGEILFEKLNLPTSKKPTKSGNYTTDVEILEDLYNKGFEIAGRVLEYRHFTKLKNTYTDILPRLIDRDNRVHTTYSNVTVITGRLSSNNPNLQNIPIRTEDGRRIRKTFISKSGYSLVGADYSQVELRILAEQANVRKLIENFEHGLDIHAETAKFVFKTDTITSDMRRIAKAINFSIVYGTTSYGLAKRLDTTNKEAKAYMDNYFSLYPEIKEYMEEMKTFASRNGYVKTMFGRICYIDLGGVKEPQKSFLERLAINAPIQGAGADIIKMAMIAVVKNLEKLDAKIIMQVHDELLLEVKNEDVEETGIILKKTMENVVKFRVPLTVEVEIGENWGDAH